MKQCTFCGESSSAFDNKEARIEHLESYHRIFKDTINYLDLASEAFEYEN